VRITAEARPSFGFEGGGRVSAATVTFEPKHESPDSNRCRSTTGRAELREILGRISTTLTTTNTLRKPGTLVGTRPYWPPPRQ
jgi:hypothetical protein